MKKFAADLLALELTATDADAVQKVLEGYRATFSNALPSTELQQQNEVPARAETRAQREWKFTAVQLTYNSSRSDFLSSNMEELGALFGRF